MLNRIINKLERVKNDIKFHYFPKFTSLVNNKENKILMYHGVDLKGNTELNTRHVSINDFKSQMLFLKKYCNVISVEDYINKKFDQNKANIAITFDDGFLNNFTNAFSILDTNKIAATFYITGINQTTEYYLWPDFLDIIAKYYKKDIIIRNNKYSLNQGKYIDENKISLNETIKFHIADYTFKQELFSTLKPVSESILQNNKLDDYYRLMSDDDIRTVSKSKYVKIGSHGFYHNNLGSIPIDEAVIELKKSKIYLENLTQYEINSLAYPDGSYTKNLIDEASKLGFKYQLAADRYLFEDSYNGIKIFNRKGIYPCDSCANQLLN